VTQHGGVATLAGGEGTLGSRKGVDNVSCADANLTAPKNKENPRSRFTCYTWTMEI
jgi:hypothetical protein